jgi:deoxycytidylate deaminase
MFRTVAAAAASLADILERRRLGIAILAMTNMIATTINNSTSENP